MRTALLVGAFYIGDAVMKAQRVETEPSEAAVRAYAWILCAAIVMDIVDFIRGSAS